MRPARLRSVRVQGNSPYAVPAEPENRKDIGGQVCEAKKTMEIPTNGPCRVREIDPLTKIKLQLFPIDDATRVGLEEAGYNPYLELILRSRKKISSVLKHIKGKWGSSTISRGEPVLFPYNTPEKTAASFCLTVYDGEISAGDVYEAIGRPVVFRLRYGWSKCETSTCLEDSKLASAGSISSQTNLAAACPQIEHLQSYTGKERVVVQDGKLKQRAMQEPVVESIKPLQVPDNEEILPCQTDNHMVTEERADKDQGQSAAIWADSLTNISIGGLLSEASLMAKVGNSESKINEHTCQPSNIPDEEKRNEDQGQTSVIWADSLTNISIGGLLSEASLMGKFADTIARANGSCNQQTVFITDSLEAFFAANTNHSQNLMLPPSEPRSSILDAEDTCHAFALKRPSSSSIEGLPLSSGNGCGFREKETGPKAGKIPKLNKDEDTVKGQSGKLQDHQHQESAVDLSFGSGAFNDESSLGLAGINWTDTLGPFDLGLPSRKT